MTALVVLHGPESQEKPLRGGLGFGAKVVGRQPV